MRASTGILARDSVRHPAAVPALLAVAHRTRRRRERRDAADDVLRVPAARSRSQPPSRARCTSSAAQAELLGDARAGARPPARPAGRRGRWSRWRPPSATASAMAERVVVAADQLVRRQLVGEHAQVAPAALRRVERRVGGVDQRRGVVAVQRGVRAADRDGHRQRAVARLHRQVGDGGADRLGDGPQVDRAGQVAHSTASSSPPQRASRSSVRRAPAARRATSRSTSSPMACPRVSLTRLKRSRSTTSTPDAVRPLAQRLLQPLLEVAAVRDARQHVGAGQPLGGGPRLDQRGVGLPGLVERLAQAAVRLAALRHVLEGRDDAVRLVGAGPQQRAGRDGDPDASPSWRGMPTSTSSNGWPVRSVTSSGVASRRTACRPPG